MECEEFLNWSEGVCEKEKQSRDFQEQILSVDLEEEREEGLFRIFQVEQWKFLNKSLVEVLGLEVEGVVFEIQILVDWSKGFIGMYREM